MFKAKVATQHWSLGELCYVEVHTRDERAEYFGDDMIRLVFDVSGCRSVLAPVGYPRICGPHREFASPGLPGVVELAPVGVVDIGMATRVALILTCIVHPMTVMMRPASAGGSLVRQDRAFDKQTRRCRKSRSPAMRREG